MMIANGFGCKLNFGRMTFALAEKYVAELKINYTSKIFLDLISIITLIKLVKSDASHEKMLLHLRYFSL